MSYPLENLIEYNDNMYEITCAIMKRAYQLANLREPTPTEKFEDKIVSQSARQIFTQQVEYRIEE
jgi:DNA-directed RNA polymerase subunit omega